MKIVDKVNQKIKDGQQFFSFEFFPPRTEEVRGGGAKGRWALLGAPIARPDVAGSRPHSRRLWPCCTATASIAGCWLVPWWCGDQERGAATP